MDGGDFTMVKKIICLLSALLCAFALNLTVFCQEADEYLEEYDNYEEFEEDYINNHVVDKINTKLPGVSVPALLIGAAAGAGVSWLVLRRYLFAPQVQPHIRKPKQKSKTVLENDSLVL